MKFPTSLKIGRYAACVILLLAFFLLFEVRLFQWQILDGDKYMEKSLNDRTDIIELDAARGQLLDINGQVLAGNRTAYDVVFNALYDTRATRNNTILKLVDLFNEQNEEWRDMLPIYVDENGEYQFFEDKDDEIAKLRETLKLAEYASAADCMSELRSTYNCDGFSTEDARTVASVRYGMVLDGYSRTHPYVAAKDVSVETIGIISQRSADLPGIEPKVSVARYYGGNGTIAPHVVGYVGPISGEQYNAAVENGTAYDNVDNISGYKWTDTIGRDGLEAAFESDLRGQRGEETIYTDEVGGIKSTAVTTKPVEGNTVYTTLDCDLQRAANISLEKNIKNNVLAKDCTSGAVVVLDVNTFGVLASSSYPSFDVNRFNELYSELSEDKDKPLFNKALQGVYVPGSSFKPLVALAALQEGTITELSTWDCPGYFEYKDLKVECLCDGGTRNIYSAIAKSCNNYFGNLGLNLTIEKMDAYAEYFGLGTTTGVELTESVGIMSNPIEYEEQHGVPWLDGASAQTAIGQADNMFTPLQLATYCATIANGGVRMRTHFLDKVTDYSGETVVRRYRPEVLMDAGISEGVQGIVKHAMINTAVYGSASGVFGDYPVTVACKTGTGQTSTDDSTEPNISFICYAPAEDPQIAVAVVLHYGNSGDYAKYIAKDVMDQYFGFYTWDDDGNRYDSYGNMVDDEGEIIKTKEELDREQAEREEEERKDLLNLPTEEPEETEPAPDDGDKDKDEYDRDNIPTVPYTGEPESSNDEDGGEGDENSQPEEGNIKTKPNKFSPYYSGSG